MNQRVALTAIVVRDYDEAIAFYRDKLGFELVEDTPLPDEKKRWVVVAPRGSGGAQILLARAGGHGVSSKSYRPRSPQQLPYSPVRAQPVRSTHRE